MTDLERRLRHYKRLRYSRTVDLRDPEGAEAYYLARVEELPGVEASGSTRHQALYHLAEAFESYLRSMIELGREIPKPEPWPDALPGERPRGGGGPRGDEASSEAEATGDEDDFSPEDWDAEAVDSAGKPELAFA